MEAGNVTLLDFFYRLVDDKDLLDSYLREPERAMADFGVEEADRNLVLSMDLKAIQEKIQSEWKWPVIVAPVIGS